MNRNLKHWTLHYIYSRASQQLNYWRHPDEPWLTNHAVLFLEQWLRPSDVGFEYGSGRSTAWFAQKSHHLMSVEHNKYWYTKVQQTLTAQDLNNVTYELHINDDIMEYNAQYTPYVQAITSIPDSTLSYVLIDGWARDYCALAAIPKICIGGLLILDNANWFLAPPNPSKLPSSVSKEKEALNSNWLNFHRLTRQWRKIWTSDGVTYTLLLIKS